MDGNFDRVMGLVGCIIGLEEHYNLTKRREIQSNATSALDDEFLSLITNNKRLFHENFSKTKTTIFSES
jgi:hypothetical protein